MDNLSLLDMGTSILTWILVTALCVMARWYIFLKAGEQGWKAVIPVYNDYIMYKLVWKPFVFWINLITIIIAAASWSAAFKYTFPFVIFMICSAVIISIKITLYSRLSRAFGHGMGYALGLVFLYTIFICIIGFGNSQYIMKNEDYSGI